MCAESYLSEIRMIDAELKKVNDHAKNLRTQKARVMSGLYNYMSANNLEMVQNGKKTIKLSQCKPKEKRGNGLVLKAKKQRRKDGIELLRDAGIPNPTQFYDEFESTQKTVKTEKSGKKTGKRVGGSNNTYDDMLGF
jgi:aspartyl/asparaginyl-tRNA synthetase